MFQRLVAILLEDCRRHSSSTSTSVQQYTTYRSIQQSIRVRLNIGRYRIESFDISKYRSFDISTYEISKFRYIKYETSKFRYIEISQFRYIEQCRTCFAPPSPGIHALTMRVLNESCFGVYIKHRTRAYRLVFCLSISYRTPIRYRYPTLPYTAFVLLLFWSCVGCLNVEAFDLLNDIQNIPDPGRVQISQIRDTSTCFFFDVRFFSLSTYLLGCWCAYVVPVAVSYTHLTLPTKA